MQHPKETFDVKPITMEYLQSPRKLEYFATADGTYGIVKGLASAFGSLVQTYVPTVLEPGAFTKTLAEHDPTEVKLNWNHAEGIGVCTALRETAEGLEMSARVTLTEKAKDYMMLVKDGVYRGLSIGFDPILSFEEQPGPGQQAVRHLTEVRLWEVSICEWPADPKAGVREAYRRSTTRMTGRLAGLQLMDAQAQQIRSILAQQGPSQASRTAPSTGPMNRHEQRIIEQYQAEASKAKAEGRLNSDGSIMPVDQSHAQVIIPLVAAYARLQRRDAQAKDVELYEARAAMGQSPRTPSMNHVRDREKLRVLDMKETKWRRARGEG
jgi:HK97 family phage prohead protease